MSESEVLKMIELLKKFRGDIVNIEEMRTATLFKEANADLKNVLNLHVSDKKAFVAAEHYLKNLYTSFNYAAAIITDGLRKKKFEADKLRMLDESLEVMIECCDRAVAVLNKRKPR